MLLKKVLRIGVSEAVAVVVAFALISISILYVVLNMYAEIWSQKYGSNSGLLPIEKMMLMYSNGRTYIYNLGSTNSEISYLVLVSENTYDKMVLNPRTTSLCTSSTGSWVISPGSNISVTCQSGFIAVAVVTSLGRVFTLDPKFYIGIIVQRQVIPVISLYNGTTVSSSSQVIKFLEVPELMKGNAINTSIPLMIYRNLTGSNIPITGTLNTSLVFIGVNPVNNKYNILIIGRATPGSSLMIGGEDIPISSIGRLRYRLKIENFTGTISPCSSPGIYPFNISEGSMKTIVINGYADRVTLYTNSSSTGYGVVGLDPYVFVGDLDGNMNVETVFVTEDFSIGGKDSINDVFRSSWGIYRAVDSNVNPFRLVFKSTPVNGKKYSIAVLSIKLFYWDNSVDDVKENDNRVIVRAGLYDPTTRTFNYSVYLSYYELYRYRNVKPFSASYIAKDFVIYIPNEDKDFYIALEILDPFDLDIVSNNYLNDADIILGIEYVGITLSSRG